MFKLFKRRRDKPSVMYGIFQKMGGAVENRQRQAADFLNRKTAPLNRKQLIWGLVAFCLVFGSSSAYTIWHSLHSSAEAIRIQPMTVPGHTILPGSEQPDETELTGQELNRIRWFRHFLDSLQQSESGKLVYDSLARHRPGLLDSLAFIERAYQLQLKTSEDGKKK